MCSKTSWQIHQARSLQVAISTGNMASPGTVRRTLLPNSARQVLRRSLRFIVLIARNLTVCIIITIIINLTVIRFMYLYVKIQICIRVFSVVRWKMRCCTYGPGAGSLLEVLTDDTRQTPTSVSTLIRHNISYDYNLLLIFSTNDTHQIRFNFSFRVRILLCDLIGRPMATKTFRVALRVSIRALLFLKKFVEKFASTAVVRRGRSINNLQSLDSSGLTYLFD